MDVAAPAGFEPHFRKSPLTDPWEPLYSRRTPDAVELGLLASTAHTNSRGFVHGGLISALADNAMGLSCSQATGRPANLVTVTLALDFLGPARLGQWLAIAPRVLKVGRALAFADALVTADGKTCARASATFSIAP
ncbi:MAG TPA: PaaI family thioesterase [Phenylobacterium sp.]|nr:PaaI family thioesterase [Phenylobacterium sp.]